jgi:hypothetical protein
MTSKHPHKASVHLIAFDRQGQRVLEQELPFRQYCERTHPLLDDQGYRKIHAIARLSGVITDANGQKSEEFEVRFDDSGACLCDAARFPDGTVLGNWEQLHC